MARDVRGAIEAAARDAWPAECCGLLVGRAAGQRICVRRAAPSPNRADEPRHAFEIDPQLWFDLRRSLEGSGNAIVGCYHSHPGGPAAPSARDLAEAWEPGFVWLIVATAGNCASETAAWLFEEDEAGRRFRPLELRDADSFDTGGC